MTHNLGYSNCLGNRLVVGRIGMMEEFVKFALIVAIRGNMRNKALWITKKESITDPFLL